MQLSLSEISQVAVNRDGTFFAPPQNNPIFHVFFGMATRPDVVTKRLSQSL